MSMNTSRTASSDVQITAKWGDQTLDLRSFQTPCCVHFGEAPTLLRSNHTLELHDDTQAILDIQGPDRGRLLCFESTLGSVQQDGETRSLAEAGQHVDGTSEIEVDIARGSHAIVCIGPVRYEITWGKQERADAFRSDWAWTRAAGMGALATLLMHAALMAMVAILSSPDTVGPLGVTDDQLNLMRRYLQASAERAPVSEESLLPRDFMDAREGGTATRAVRDEPGWGAGGVGLSSIGETAVGRGSGQGIGSGHGRLGGAHRTRAPEISFGFSSVQSNERSKSARPTPRVAAPSAPAMATATEESAIDPNGRFATTYRPGGGHLSAFDAAVERGVIPVGHRDLVAGVAARHALDVPVNPDGAMSFLPSLERSQLPPSGGTFHLRFAMRSAVKAPEVRPRLSVHLVLDTSGSMQGDPIAHARDAARALVDRLLPTDHFSLVTFATEGQVHVSTGPVGPRRKAIHSAIADIWPRGGTNLGEGLQLAYAQAKKPTDSQDVVPVVLVVSDGQANEGITGSTELSRLALDAFQEGIQTSTFGVGTDYDGPLMSRIASDGAGGYYYLPGSDQIAAALTSELTKRLRPVATALEVRFRLRHGVELLHVYGSERLSEREASRVREVEVAADQHAQKRDGISANRQNDLDGGMRFFLPTFAADDRHALLFKLRVPAGVAERKVGVIEVRFKDRVTKRNQTEEFPIAVAYANSDAESAQTIDRSVVRTIQAHLAGESLLFASRHVAEGRHDQALAVLSEREVILREAAGRYQDPLFLEDASRLAKIRSRLDRRAEPFALAVLLEAAGRSVL
jgi:uncharacterized protein YegL